MPDDVADSVERPSGAGPEQAGPRRGQLSALLQELADAPAPEDALVWERGPGPGAVIGRFELVREVGRGGFGIVYEARDRELGRTVAFKAVRVGRGRDLREERLLREAEAAARCSHPNIVTLFDVGRSEQGPYLVLEFLRGRTLERRLAQGALAVSEALRIAVEVAKGLAHAHAQGVVHRDLTPGNVFLCDDGRVKVLDLGMAHAFGTRRTAGGTPGYMAPEQQRGAPEDERTDVFALGVILYRMLAGELPFPEADPDRSPPALDVPGAPALGALVGRMLQRDPVRRPRDAGEVLASLTAFQQELERAPAAARAARVRSPRRARVALVALSAVGVVVVGLVAAVVVTQRGRAPIPAPAATASIAVLPFVDLSPQKDQEYFSDGVSEEILNSLARVEGLRVPARASSFFFKGKDARLADIGRELHVAVVLEGSVRRAGNRVRVSAEMVNVADGLRLWGETYDRELTDIFAVQDEIARAVADALRGRLTASRTSPATGLATANPEVYTQYLLGRQAYYRYNTKSFREAVEAYERALALEPDYAPALAGLGIPLYYLASQAQSRAELEAQRRRALAAANRAVALAPDLADALSTRGVLRGVIDYDWAGAKADFERAIASNPNDANALRRYGILLDDLGRLSEAIATVRRAVDLDPFGPSWGKLGQLYQAAGDLDAAESAFRRDLQVRPEGLPGTLGLATNLLLQSRPAEALAAFERLRDEESRLWGRALAEHALGHDAASRAALDALVARYAHSFAGDIAQVYAWRGDAESAFAWLERAAAQHDPNFSEGFRSDPLLRSLRGDPRYRELLRKVNLPVD